jgi:hypothetical protein
VAEVLTPGQVQARAYLKFINTRLKIHRAPPPVCDGCSRSTPSFGDAYEISVTSRCGFCQGWNRLPLAARVVIRRLLDGMDDHQSSGLLEELIRSIVYRPNYEVICKAGK